METQASVGKWIGETFPGADPESPRKSLRALEELVELCLVSGASAYEVTKTVATVLEKEGRTPTAGRYYTSERRPEKIPAEAADTSIVLMGLAELVGFDLQAQIDKKMSVNRSRKWKANGDGTGYHIRETNDGEHDQGPRA